MWKALISTFGVLFAISVAQAQQPYVAIDFPGANHTELTAVSPAGDIVGRYLDSNGVQHGLLYSKGKFTSIDYPGAVFIDTAYINPRGGIVGFYVDTNFVLHGYVLTNNKFTTIDYPDAMGTLSYGISPSGVVVGPYFKADFKTHSYLFSNKGFSALPDFPGANETYATMMAGGLIVGFIVNLNGDGNYHGFALKHGAFSTVDYPGALYSLVSGLNPVGEMVGGIR